VMILSEALPPAKKSSPHTLLNTALGAFLGLLFGAALAVALEMRRPRLRIPGDIVSLLQVPVLASMPRVTARVRRRPDLRAAPLGASA
jgi:succinoglycan biosynthesis transport protein ExoP